MPPNAGSPRPRKDLFPKTSVHQKGQLPTPLNPQVLGSPNPKGEAGFNS